ncbi:helix-turn-helix domain-containing protein [Pandoraea pneumonica]|uniref:helix-turn-helix domain-containing protein n=1 Tax=Pandoraea pneumonica TaxID=2508299 RepID=UPI003CEA3831
MQTNPLALFGDHLAHLRKARGWSQEKLALESGLARSYVSGIERGRRNVALVNICVLADTLGVPTSEMLRFSQMPAGTDASTTTTERTPLPQISRSLGRLENRDQVWLAEIIRSLSSRLSHAGAPVHASHVLHGDDSSPNRSFDTTHGSPLVSACPADAHRREAMDEDECDDGIGNENLSAAADTDSANPLASGDEHRNAHIEPRFDNRYAASLHPTPSERALPSGEIAPHVREPEAEPSAIHEGPRFSDTTTPSADNVSHDASHRSPAIDEE